MNYFESILEKNGWLPEQEVEETIDNNYVPTAKTLIKLEEDNLSLIQFLQKLNPFQEKREDFVCLHNMLHSIKASEFKRTFPLKSTVIKKLGTKGTNVVLDKWKNDVIIRNISKYKDLLLPHNRPDITEADLLEVFVEPTVRITKEIVLNNNRFFDVYTYMGDFSFHAARITTDFHPYFKESLKEQWIAKIMHKQYTFKDIASYRLCKYAFLDEALNELFETKSIQNLKNLRHIEDFLSFVHMSKKVVLEKSKTLLEEYVELVKELTEEIKKKEQYKLTEDYLSSPIEEKRRFDYEYKNAKVKSVEMKNTLISTLELFSKI